MVAVTENDIVGLRNGAHGHNANVRAAVELLIEPGRWLQDDNFVGACTGPAGDDCLRVDFARAWDCARTYRASEDQRAMLIFIADLWSGRWNLGSLAARDRMRIADAMMRALVEA